MRVLRTRVWLRSSVGVFALITASVTLLLAAACTWTTMRRELPELEPLATTTPPAPAPTPTSERATEPTTQPEQPAADPAVQIAESLNIGIHHVEGTSPELAGVIFEPVVDSLERCTARESGSVHVRVVTEGDRTAMDIAPGSNVDPDTRRCILQALSMLDVAEGLPPAATAAERPKSFSSTISVSW